MKKIILVALLMLAISCTSEKEKREKQALNSISNTIENDAFKKNTTTKFHSFELVEMYKVPGTIMDQLYLEKLIEESKRYRALAKVEANKIENYTELMNSLNVIEMQQKGTSSALLLKEYLSKSQDYLNEATEVEKSMQSVQLDSLWAVKVFMKASFTYDNEVNNVLDTIVYVLNNKLELQNFKEIENN